MNYWQNLEKIFIGNAKGFQTDNLGYVTKEWILDNNPSYIQRTIVKPVGLMGEMTSLITKEHIRYYRDGRVERKFSYIADPPAVNGISILNPFGHKMMQ